MSTNMGALGSGDIEEGSFNNYVSDTEQMIIQIEEPIEKMADGENTNVNVSDLEKWVSSLESMLEDVPKYMCNQGHPGRISKIPENLREVDLKSYEPCYLSLGPYHHEKTSLQRMQKRKWAILKCFLEQKPELTLKDMVMEIKSLEPLARNFYTSVEMESEKFVQMLLLDSLYLVVVFSGMPRSWNNMDNEDPNNGMSEDTQLMTRVDQINDGKSEDVTMNGPAWYWTLLAHDLFLLENQLPFFVLEKMHDLAYGGSRAQFIVTVKTMFHHLLFDYVKINSEMEIMPTEEIHHLLHLCHWFFRPKLQQDLPTCQLTESSQMFRLGSAVQLYEAGVSFEAKSGSTHNNLLDITFTSSGKMVMPCLHVDDNTNSLLRNFIALEQMKYPNLGLDISAYAVLLLHLVTTPDDVMLLRRKGIIQHHLATDKDMMYLINRLSVGLAFDYVEDKYSLKPVFYELKRFSSSRVPRWRAWLKHKYFNNPWTAMSLVAASLLLVLSATQTYYAVYSYYHPFFDGHS